MGKPGGWQGESKPQSHRDMQWSSCRGEELSHLMELVPKQQQRCPVLHGLHGSGAWGTSSTSKRMTPGGCPWLEWVALELVLLGSTTQQQDPAGSPLSASVSSS